MNKQYISIDTETNGNEILVNLSTRMSETIIYATYFGITIRIFFIMMCCRRRIGTDAL